jgi:UDP-glucose 4-epimerase
LLPVVQKLISGKESYIGKEPQKLSFVYVKDLAAVSVKALYGGNFKTYNICDGNFYDRNELQGIIKDILNLHTAKFHLPVTFVKILASFKEKVSYLGGKFPTVTTDRLKDLTATNWACSIEPAKQELGFYPAYNLDSGLEETINWYKANNWL